MTTKKHLGRLKKVLGLYKLYRFRDISTEEALERGGERGEFGGAFGDIRRVRPDGISSVKEGELLRQVEEGCPKNGFDKISGYPAPIIVHYSYRTHDVRVSAAYQPPRGHRHR